MPEEEDNEDLDGLDMIFNAISNANPDAIRNILIICNLGLEKILDTSLMSEHDVCKIAP